MTSKQKINSLFKRTKEQIYLRKRFFENNEFKNERDVAIKLKQQSKVVNNQDKGASLLSLSENLPYLKDTNYEQLCVENVNEKSTYPQIMREASSGESTPSQSNNEEDEYKDNTLSFQEVCQLVVDCSLLVIDQMEPMRVDKYQKLPKEWEHVKEIMLVGIEKDLEEVKNKHCVQNLFENQFYQFKFVKFARFRVIFYKSKLAITIKFDDENSTQFVYFNIHQKIGMFKKELGIYLEVYRVIENKTRNPPKSTWMAVLIRNLPNKIKKEDLENVIQQKLTSFSIEDLVTFDKLKYGLVKVENMESAEILIKYLEEISKQTNLRPSIRTNIHPLSSKKYNNRQQSVYKSFFIEPEESNQSCIMLNDLKKLRNDIKRLKEEEDLIKEEEVKQRKQQEDIERMQIQEKIKQDEEETKKKLQEIEQQHKRDEEINIKKRQNIYELQKNKREEKENQERKRKKLSLSLSPRSSNNNYIKSQTKVGKETPEYEGMNNKKYFENEFQGFDEQEKNDQNSISHHPQSSSSEKSQQNPSKNRKIYSNNASPVIERDHSRSYTNPKYDKQYYKNYNRDDQNRQNRYYKVYDDNNNKNYNNNNNNYYNKQHFNRDTYDRNNNNNNRNNNNYSNQKNYRNDRDKFEKYEKYDPRGDKFDNPRKQYNNNNIKNYDNYQRKSRSRSRSRDRQYSQQNVKFDRNKSNYNNYRHMNKGNKDD